MAKLSVAEALQALSDRNQGHLTPEMVVQAASDPASPLHEHFIWDDAVAGAVQRLDAARRLMRSVKVEIRTEHFTFKAPGYVRNPTLPERQQGYVWTPSLRRNPDVARDAIVQEFARAKAALRRARDLAGALGLADEVEAVMDRLDMARDVLAERPRAAA